MHRVLRPKATLIFDPRAARLGHSAGLVALVAPGHHRFGQNLRQEFLLRVVSEVPGLLLVQGRLAAFLSTSALAAPEHRTHCGYEAGQHRAGEPGRMSRSCGPEPGSPRIRLPEWIARVVPAHGSLDRADAIGVQRAQPAARRGVECLDCGDERSLAGVGILQCLVRTADPVRKQPAPKSADRATCILVFPINLDAQIAFCVEAHRAIVQVCRPRSHETIIDDQDLGVNDDPASASGVWQVRPQATIPVRPVEEGGHRVSRTVHQQAVEPARAMGGNDRYDFGAIWLCQARGQSLPDHRRGEVLILDVDGLLCRSDGFQKESL